MSAVVAVIRRFVSAALACALVSCGGGGGGDPAPANQAPIASAGAAQTLLASAAVTLDGSASSDPEGRALAYSWSFTSRPPGSAAVLAGAGTARPTFVADAAGSYVVSLRVDDGQGAVADSTVTITALATAGLQIQADQNEPLSGSVQLSLSGPVAGAPVSWFVDLQSLGARAATATWQTAGMANGSHLVVARVEASPGNVVEVRRTFEVINSPINLTITVPSPGITPLNVEVVANSGAGGIASVSATLDGASLGTLTSPNANPYYRFTIAGDRVPTGTHTLVVTATDAVGNRLSRTLPVAISNAPRITLTTPADGAFVAGSLAVAGSAASDKPGTVTVTATLGQLEILRTTTPAFATSFDLAGIPPGQYTLGVQAVDGDGLTGSVTRTVVVASSADQAYAPVFTLGPQGRMLAAEGDLLLYWAGDDSVRVRDVVRATEVVLQPVPGVSTPNVSQWRLAGGRVYAEASVGSDCGPRTCIYEWLPDGTRRNYSLATPTLAAPVSRGGFLVTRDLAQGAPTTFIVQDMASGRLTAIAPPPGLFHSSADRFEFAVVRGVAYLVYSMSGSSGDKAIYLWRSDTGISTRVSALDEYPADLQTDGVRVAWTYGMLGNVRRPLFALPLAGGSPTQMAGETSEFALRDGVLAWTEPSIPRVLRASTAAGTSLISAAAAQFWVGNGRVLYTEGSGTVGKLYVWNGATGQSALKAGVFPSFVLVTVDKFYFTVGETKALYYVPLD